MLGEACPDWVLYVTGRFAAELPAMPASSDPNDLREDMKFTELVATALSSLRQMQLLNRRHATLSQFFSPVVLNTLGNEDPDVVLAPRETEVSVLFCDLRGFSRHSERHADDLLELLNRVSQALGVMTHHILEQGGVVGDFQGDAAMGFWGWPLAQEDAVLRTCRAALAIRSQFESAARDPESPLAGFHAGIGIATGRAVAGKIGTVDHVKVTVFGPVVNLASRLEGMTKTLRAPILLDEATARAARRQVPRDVGRVRRLAVVRPYGLDTPLEVSELLPPALAVSPAERRAPGVLRGGAGRVSRGALAGRVRASAPHPGGRRGRRLPHRLHRPAQPHAAAGLGRRDPAGQQVSFQPPPRRTRSAAPDVRLYLLDRLGGVDHDDAAGLPGGFGQETLAHPGVEAVALLLHAVPLAVQPRGSSLRRHVQNDRQVGQDAIRGHAAHFPQRRSVQSSAVALIHHIGQKVPIRYHGLLLGQGGADHLLDHLGPGRHVEKHLAAAVDPQVVTVQQEFADRLAQRRASRVAAGDHLVALPAEPLAEHGHLGALAGSVAAVDGEEHGESRVQSRGSRVESRK